MADQLLSVQSEHLEQIANEIRLKTNTNEKLAFPNGFIDAINSIDTYANATDKVSPQTITLTPTNTSYTIPVGTHDGTDIVKIKIKSDTTELTPSTHEVTAEATGDEFLGTVLVKGVSANNNYKVKTGTVQANNQTTLTINNIGFKATNCILFLQNYHSTTSLNKVASLQNVYTPGCIGICGDNNKRVIYDSGSPFTFNDNSITVSSTNMEDNKKATSIVFAGTYYYVAWRDPNV